MTNGVRGSDQIREQFITRAVSAGHPREDVEAMIAGLTPEDLAEKQGQLDEVLEQGDELSPRGRQQVLSFKEVVFGAYVSGLLSNVEGPGTSGGSRGPDQIG